MAYKVQKIFEWFKQFDKNDIKIKGETKEFDIELGNKYLPHLLGLQYINDNFSPKKGYDLYNYIKNNNFSDEDILKKVRQYNPDKIVSVEKRIKTFQEFLENIEKGVIVEKTYSNTTIKSDYFIVQSKGNNFLHLGIKQENMGSFINGFDVIPKKDSWLETYFIENNNIKYFDQSKIMEEIKELYKYNEDKQEKNKINIGIKNVEYDIRTDIGINYTKDGKDYKAIVERY